MTDQTLANDMATDAHGDTENQATAERVYTQRELDAMMARMRSKYERQYSELGDINELKRLKTEAEQRKQEEAVKRGEFERVLQEIAAKKDSEIQKRDQIIREYKVNTPLVNAAAKFRSVNPEQVKSLLANHVRLDDNGDVVVTDTEGKIRYNDAGKPLEVENLVREFLDSNPHFVQPTPATTNTRSNVSAGAPRALDITKLDMRNPEHRKQYAEYRKQNGLA